MNNKTFVYSIGAFENLSQDFKKNKAIIRMHNLKNAVWYENTKEENSIWLFFDDVHINDLTFWEKLKFIHLGLNGHVFSYQQAKIAISFIEKHKNKDFIIHCEYGKSRSVAFAIFLKEYYGHIIFNKENNELNKANTLVLYLLKKTFKKYLNTSYFSN